MEDQVKELYGRMDQMQEGVNELKDQKVHGNDEQGKKGSRRRLTRGGVTWLLKANRLFPKVCISTLRKCSATRPVLVITGERIDALLQNSRSNHGSKGIEKEDWGQKEGGESISVTWGTPRWYWRHPTQVTRRPSLPIPFSPYQFPYAHVNSLSQPSYQTSLLPFQPNSRSPWPAPQSPAHPTDPEANQRGPRQKENGAHVIDWILDYLNGLKIIWLRQYLCHPYNHRIPDGTTHDAIITQVSSDIPQKIWLRWKKNKRRVYELDFAKLTGEPDVNSQG
jgi:hypothetical protein